MDDSYYGTGRPTSGRHTRSSSSGADDAPVRENPLNTADGSEIGDAVGTAFDAPAESPVAEGAAENVAEAGGEGLVGLAAEGAAEAAAGPAAEKAAEEAAEAAVGPAAGPAAEKAVEAGGEAGAAGRHAGDKAKKKRGPWGIVFIVALIVFICSMSALALIAFSYCQGQQKYDSVARDAGLDVTDTSDLGLLTIDWDALRAANPEVVGWVYVPNTAINYPVVQGPDNDKYLTVDFDGDAGWLANYGAIFLDYRNKPDFSDKANFIYGHHMNDGSMFADLAGFGDQARFDECRTVYLLTPGANYRLRSFSLLHVDGSDPLVQNEFADDAEFQAYVQDKIDRSVVDPGSIPSAKDLGRVFALATCDDYGSGRFVLYCYVEDEKASGLSGNLGIAQEDGAAVGFNDGLSAETAQQADAGQQAGERQGSEQGEGESEQSWEEY